MIFFRASVPQSTEVAEGARTWMQRQGIGVSTYLILDEKLDSLNRSSGSFLWLLLAAAPYQMRFVPLTETAAETPPIRKSTRKPGLHSC